MSEQGKTRKRGLFTAKKCRYVDKNGNRCSGNVYVRALFCCDDHKEHEKEYQELSKQICHIILEKGIRKGQECGRKFCRTHSDILPRNKKKKVVPIKMNRGNGNIEKKPGLSSEYIGVHWDKENKKYRGEYRDDDGKKRNIGRSSDPIDLATKRDIAVLKTKRGSSAPINFALITYINEL